jgi:hypothetical protein
VVDGVDGVVGGLSGYPWVPTLESVVTGRVSSVTAWKTLGTASSMEVTVTLVTVSLGTV